MPLEIVEQLKLSTLAEKYPDRLILKRIQMNHFYYMGGSAAKKVGFLCMLFDDCLEYVTAYKVTKWTIGKEKVIRELLLGVVAKFASAIQDYENAVRLSAQAAAGPMGSYKCLADTYKNEMVNFLAVPTPDNAATQNPGYRKMVAYRDLSAVHDPSEAVRTGGDLVVKKELFEQVQKATGLTPNQITQNPILLSRIVERSTNDSCVVYLRKQTRLQFQLHINGGILQRVNPLHLDVNDPAHLENLDTNNRSWMYVVSPAFDFYALNDKDPALLAQNNGIELNHSSVLKGRPIQCAGLVEVSNGKIVYINNGSGHYQPNWKAMRTFLSRPDIQTVLGPQAKVSFFDKGPGNILYQFAWATSEFIVDGFKAIPYRMENMAYVKLQRNFYIQRITETDLASYMEIQTNQINPH